MNKLGPKMTAAGGHELLAGYAEGRTSRRPPAADHAVIRKAWFNFRLYAGRA